MVLRRPRCFTLLAAGLLLAGCRDTKITTYRAPKEVPAGSTIAAEAPAPAIRWQTPAGWQEQAAGNVRQGSFLVAGEGGAQADMSVISFPGDVGGDLANVNRWRNQIQLPPITEAELPAAFASVSGPAGEFRMIDVANGGSRTLGAILKQSDRSWFFKLTGESALVGAQKEMFVAFLKSVDFPAEGPAAPGTALRRMASTNDLPPAARGISTGPLTESALPPGHPPIDGSTMPAAGAGMANTPVPTASGPALTWTAPAHWRTKTGSAMRKDSYAVPGSEGEGDLSITAFPGDVGGDLANINRWRGQVGLPPVADVASGAQTLEAGGMKMLLVDAANNGNRILGAIVSRPGETWFFKLTGPDPLLAREKTAFVAFLQTVKAP